MKYLTFFCLLTISINCVAQKEKANEIDNTLTVDGRKKHYTEKGIFIKRKEGRIFTFLKENGNLFRIDILKRRKDTTYTYLFVNNSLVRLDISFFGNKKKFLLYYFNKNEIIYKINKGMGEVEEKYLLIRLPELLEEVDKLRNR
jgi:hypothetical protein